MTARLYDFSKPAEQLLTDLIQLSNDITLNPEELYFSTPVAKGRTSTDIKITPKPTSTMKGIVEVNYERVDLNSLFFGATFNMVTDELIDNNLVVAAINNDFRVNINPEEIIVELEEYEIGYPKSLVVRSLEDSLVWVGELKGWVMPVNHLGETLQYYKSSRNVNGTKQNAYIYSITKPFAPLTQTLVDGLTIDRRIYTIDVLTNELLNYLFAYTGDLWTVSQDPVDFNLFDARVVFNGLVADNGTEHAIVLSLGERCTNLEGMLVIKYDLVV